ncbi:hypothetical protein CC1G_04137 [Coprinopsis cinerea okayama7|uniref:Uncharacterized protein n=1 Tax=Coprinopsis cinerea (strain Okayama-7 / 130 / ATCC MYA-4618 / FGSC 9003) TaxID=240176 RepID=A8NW44_COPC7|nr:hypothetical protein CC1G_04137 [Coprinopsis cinerea okayama7\|eukprot:XP_001836824.1 hypothetical protein CC1G_04137 [Coprinopsis cinerea okayama7\
MSNKDAKTKALAPSNNEARSRERKATPPPDIVAGIERLTALVEEASAWRRGRQDVTKKQELLDLTEKVFESWNRLGWSKEALPSAIREWFKHIASPAVADWDGLPETLDLTFFRKLKADTHGDNLKKKSSKRKVAFEGQPQTTKKKKSEIDSLEARQGQGEGERGKAATVKGEKAAEKLEKPQAKGGDGPPKPRPRPRPTTTVKTNGLTSQPSAESDQSREFMMVVAGLNEGKGRTGQIGQSITTNPYSSDSGSESSTSSDSGDRVKARKAKRKATPPTALVNSVQTLPTIAKLTAVTTAPVSRHIEAKPTAVTTAPVSRHIEAKPTAVTTAPPPSQNSTVSRQIDAAVTVANAPASTVFKPAADPPAKNAVPKRPFPSHSTQEHHHATGTAPNRGQFLDRDNDDDASYQPSNSSDDEGLGSRAVGKNTQQGSKKTSSNKQTSKKTAANAAQASSGSSNDERWSRVAPFSASELTQTSVAETLHALTVKSHLQGATIRQLESKVSTITRAFERNQNTEKAVPVLEKRLNEAIRSLDELRQDLKAEQQKTAELEAREREREKKLEDYRSNLKLLNGVVERLLEVHGLRRIPDSTLLVPLPPTVVGSTQVQQGAEQSTTTLRQQAPHPALSDTQPPNSYPRSTSLSVNFTRAAPSTGLRMASMSMPASTASSINSYVSQGQTPNSSAMSFHHRNFTHPDQTFHSDRSANADINPLQPIISEVHRTQMDLPHELQPSPVQRASFIEMIAHSSVGTTPDMIHQMQMLDDRGSRGGRSSTSAADGESLSDWGNISGGKFKYHPQNHIQQPTLELTRNTPNDRSAYNGGVNAVGGLTISSNKFQQPHQGSTTGVRGEFHPIGSLTIAQDQEERNTQNQ